METRGVSIRAIWRGPGDGTWHWSCSRKIHLVSAGEHVQSKKNHIRRQNNLMNARKCKQGSLSANDQEAKPATRDWFREGLLLDCLPSATPLFPTSKTHPSSRPIERLVASRASTAFLIGHPSRGHQVIPPSRPTGDASCGNSPRGSRSGSSGVGVTGVIVGWLHRRQAPFSPDESTGKRETPRGM